MGKLEKPKDGVVPTEYPTTPLLLEKTPKRHNILVGEDAMQVRFAERFLSSHHHVKVACQSVDAVHDDHVLGREEPQLYRVERSSLIELSPNLRSRTGIWSLDIIEKGSAGANAIVRAAARLTGLARPTRQVSDYVATEITKNLYDIYAAIWYAAWLLSAPVPEKANWPRPWENYITWLPRNEDPKYRLNSLYWELIQYVFAASNDEKGWRKCGRQFRPREFQKLSQISLPKERVFNTICVLSAWREQKGDPYICALKVAKFWERQ